MLKQTANSTDLCPGQKISFVGSYSEWPKHVHVTVTIYTLLPTALPGMTIICHTSYRPIQQKRGNGQENRKLQGTQFYFNVSHLIVHLVLSRIYLKRIAECQKLEGGLGQ